MKSDDAMLPGDVIFAAAMERLGRGASWSLKPSTLCAVEDASVEARLALLPVLKLVDADGTGTMGSLRFLIVSSTS